MRCAARSGPRACAAWHSGQLKTLGDVVAFYDQGGGAVPDGGTLDRLVTPLMLTAVEREDLIAFLSTLDGAAVDPALLVNTARENLVGVRGPGQWLSISEMVLRNSFSLSSTTPSTPTNHSAAACTTPRC